MYLRRSRYPGELEESRPHIHEAHAQIDGSALLDPRTANHERNVQLLLVPRESVPQGPVFREGFAMVGDDDDDRVVGQIEPVEFRQEALYLIIDLSNRAVIRIHSISLRRGHIRSNCLRIGTEFLGVRGAGDVRRMRFVGMKEEEEAFVPMFS